MVAAWFPLTETLMIKTGCHFDAGMMVATTKKTAAEDARIAFEGHQIIKPLAQNKRRSQS